MFGKSIRIKSLNVKCTDSDFEVQEEEHEIAIFVKHHEKNYYVIYIDNQEILRLEEQEFNKLHELIHEIQEL